MRICDFRFRTFRTFETGRHCSRGFPRERTGDKGRIQTCCCCTPRRLIRDVTRKFPPWRGCVRRLEDLRRLTGLSSYRVLDGPNDRQFHSPELSGAARPVSDEPGRTALELSSRNIHKGTKDEFQPVVTSYERAQSGDDAC